ncbi:MAG: RNA 2',3'-cyclic phosphodiesterase [Gammaproteobacteria bacterium]|nr:RNA 2',3'-cyclic phosphodiesterase [Gammaproteobacteria bacterium]
MSDSAPGPKQRLFLALWPDDALRHRIAEVAAACRVSGGRPVPRANWHITLAFLGSLDGETRRCVEHMAAAVRVPAFDLGLDRVGFWPRPGGILWLGSSGPPEALGRLVAHLCDGISICGVERDRRHFHAHLTLMRRVERAVRVDLPTPLCWPVADFVLCESVTDPGGARYRVLARWALGQ